MNQPLFDKIKDCLKTYYPCIELAIVFGSFAQSKERKNSDLDIALAAQEKLPIDLRISILNSISLLINRNVDLIDLNDVSGTILKEILVKGHVILKQDVLLYARIIYRMLVDEEDFQKQRRRLAQQQRKRILNEL